MTILAAILAGGQSRRFGSNKAQALWHGMPLIDHVAARLRPQVDALVVLDASHDLPAPGVGPLGGLLAALRCAASQGYSAVLSAPCDTPQLPIDLALRLAPGPAIAVTVVRAHPIIGLWPVALADALETYINSREHRPLYGWAEACAARRVVFPDEAAFANINRPEDLEALP
jgi:molybdenum cofactor guanylyltransferase